MQPQAGPRGARAVLPSSLEMAEQVPMKIPLRVNAADASDASAFPSHGVSYAAPSPAETLACLTAQLPGAAHEHTGVLPTHLLEGCSSAGEWVNCMLAAAPHLSPDGLKEARMIFERAIENIQQAKAVDRMITSTFDAGGVFMQMPHLAAAMTMKAHISQQQQNLMCQLRHLRATNPVGSGSSSSPLEAGELMQRLTEQLRQKADLQAANLASQHVQSRAGQQWGDRAPPRKGPARGSDGGVGVVHVGRTGSATLKSSTGETKDEVQLEGKRRPAHTLSWSLHVLSSEDPDCVIIVRRINRLGLKSVRHLRKHFSSYGPVVRVLVAHSTVYPDSSDKALRQRPSSLGFVHMSTPEAAQAILAMGSEQEVDGVTIRVQRFEGSAGEKQDLEGETGAVKNRQSSDAEASAATTAPASSGARGSSEADSDEKGDTPEKVGSSEKAGRPERGGLRGEIGSQSVFGGEGRLKRERMKGLLGRKGGV